MNSIRSILHAVARLLGDINAVNRVTAGKRIARRLVGRATGRVLWRLFR